MSFLLPLLQASITKLLRTRASPVAREARGVRAVRLAENRLPATPDRFGGGAAAQCARLIGKARWRARLRFHDARLEALLLQAGERLDDLDETLLRCHPARDGALFAEAARLHRELERVQASMSAVRRKRRVPWLSVDAPAASEASGGARPRGR